MTSPIQFPGDPDAGGRDDVAGSVAEAMANAQARYAEHERDTYGLGSTIGDTVTLPPTPEYTLPPPPVGGYPNQGDEPVDAA